MTVAKNSLQSLLVELIQAEAKYGINSSVQITVVLYTYFTTKIYNTVYKVNTTVQLLRGVNSKSKMTFHIDWSE